MSGTHARLSASSAHRWLICAGSVEEGGGKPSIYAATGTFAHEIGAKCLADNTLSPSDFLLKRAKVDGFDVECDQEMVEALDLYLDTIAADTQEGDLSWIEMPLHEPLAKIDKDLGGTADFVRYRPSIRQLRVNDLKYGSGVFVEAEGNPQLKKYALGAMLEVLEKYKLLVDEVEVAIVQPRFEGAAPVRVFAFRAIELLDFVADLKEAAARTRLPEPPLVAGEHCKFCPKARTCPELLKRQHALVAADFGPTNVKTYDAVELAKALEAIPLVKERIKALEQFAYSEALKGEHIPGFKLVDKEPRRKWKDEAAVVAWAEGAKIDPYAPREVMSPAQLEKKLGENAPRGKKKDAGRVIEHFYEKVSSGTALVPESDDRQPVKLIAQTDFPALK